MSVNAEGLALEYLPRAWLRPAPGNPRTHPPAQLAALRRSIAAFGFANPILARPDGEIVAGEARWLAAADLELLPVIVLAHLTAAEAKALRLADNRIAELGGWNLDRLGDALAELADAPIDLAGLGFSDEELGALLAPTVEACAGALPALPSGERPPFEQMTFTLHVRQVETVRGALKTAKAAGPFEGPNRNGNGNALARIAEAYLAAVG